MTQAEAERAAATFEFPGYRAEAMKFYRLGNKTNEITGVDWLLRVTGANDDDPLYFTIEEWRRAWANMQAGRPYFVDRSNTQE